MICAAPEQKNIHDDLEMMENGTKTKTLKFNNRYKSFPVDPSKTGCEARPIDKCSCGEENAFLDLHKGK